MPGEEVTKSAGEELLETYMDEAPEKPVEDVEIVEPVEDGDGEETAEDSAVAEENGEEAAAEGGDQASGDEDQESDEDLGLSDEEKATLKESTQKKLNERFAELTRTKTDLETKAVTEQERADAAEQEAAALRTQLDSIGRGQVMQAAGIDPLLAAEDEGEIVQAETRWKQIKRFTQRHVNSNLGENEAGEVIAVRETNPTTGVVTEFTQEQVAARLDQAEDMLETTIPQARKLFQQRMATLGAAKKVYPELFKKDSEDAKAMKNAMRAIPGLSVLPNASILVGDMLVGNKLRLPDVKEITVAGRTFVLKGSATAAAPGKKVPKVPSKPAPAGPSPVAAKSKGSKMFDQAAIDEAEDPRAAALNEYRKIV